MRGQILALLIFLTLLQTTLALEIDSEGYVTYVVDGDTIDVYATSGFGVGTKYRIRFADINAPELSTFEGQMAKLALQNLLDNEYVYIDVDDITTYDKYGRVVAVVYLPVNSTHVLNVNYYMVVNGYAEIWDFTNNEFNPYTWKLYELVGETTKKVVNLDTGEEFTSIQEAIDDPDTENGHTIVIYPGTYEENVVVNKSVTITSYTGNSSDVTLRASNPSLPTMKIFADNVSISGITITGQTTTSSTVLVYGNFTKILNNSIEGYLDSLYIFGSHCLVSRNKIIGDLAIFWQKVENVTISFNEFESGEIYCAQCENVRILENNISSNHDSVRIDHSNGVYIVKNIVSGFVGISIHESSNIYVELNTISASFAGIEIMSSDNNKISSNVIYSDEDATGIRLFYSSNNTIDDNILYNGGIYVEYGDGYSYKTQNNSVFNNTVNGKPLIYLENEKDISVVNAGQVIAINCTNITIADSNISNVYVGVEFIDTSDSTIENCTISNTEYGIYLKKATKGSKNNLISSNNISNCEVGILIDNFQYSHMNCNTIVNNLISDCNTGVELMDTQHNIVKNNTIIKGSWGLYLATASHNQIESNTLEESGLCLSSSSHNIIYNNIFNLKSFSISCNLFSISCSNTWNITKTLGKNILGGNNLGGNVWIKPDGTGFSQTCADEDLDGICDEAFNLSEFYGFPIGNVDYLPLKYVKTDPLTGYTDPDGDGLYEDVNGDGYFNFGDVVALFKNFEGWHSAGYDEYYDFNCDGTLNFGDVVALFKELP